MYNTGSYDVATGATQAGGHGSSSAGPALPSEEMLSHDEILAQREQQRVLMARRRAEDPLMLARRDPVAVMVTPERLQQHGLDRPFPILDYRTEDEARAWEALGVEPPRRNPAMYPPPPSVAEGTDSATYGGSDPAVMYDLLDRITEPEPRARDVYVQHQAQLRQQMPVAVSGREHVGERSLPAQFPGVISTNQMPLSPDPMKDLFTTRTPVGVVHETPTTGPAVVASASRVAATGLPADARRAAPSRRLDGNEIDLALQAYELYHGLPAGAATFEQVYLSSAGLEGWFDHWRAVQERQLQVLRQKAADETAVGVEPGFLDLDLLEAMQQEIAPPPPPAPDASRAGPPEATLRAPPPQPPPAPPPPTLELGANPKTIDGLPVHGVPLPAAPAPMRDSSSAPVPLVPPARPPAPSSLQHAPPSAWWPAWRDGKVQQSRMPWMGQPLIDMEHDDEGIREFKNAKCQTAWKHDHGLFLPNGEAYDKWIELIDRACRSIRILMFVFSEPKMAKRIIQARKRGVNVHICLDREQYENEEKLKRGRSTGILKVYDDLVAAGCHITLVTGFNVDGYSGIMHCKTLIIDKTEMVIGSNNLSKRARHRNREQAYHIRNDPLSINRARREFNDIYMSGIVCHNLAEDHERMSDVDIENESNMPSEVSELLTDPPSEMTSSQAGARRAARAGRVPRSEDDSAPSEVSDPSHPSDATTVPLCAYDGAGAMSQYGGSHGTPAYRTPERCSDGCNGSCQSKESYAEKVVRARRETLEALGVTRGVEEIRFTLPPNVLYPHYVTELVQNLSNKEGKSLVTDIKTTTVSSIPAKYANIITEVRTLVQAGKPGKALQAVHAWVKNCLNQVCGDMSNSAGMEFARWIRDTGKYIWSQFIKLRKEDQGKYRRTVIQVPEVFSTLEGKMGEIWRKMVPPDFGRWTIPAKERLNHEAGTPQLQSPDYIFLIFKEAYRGTLEERTKIQSELGSAGANGPNRNADNYPAKKTAQNLWKYGESLTMLRSFGLEPYKKEFVRSHIRAMTRNLETVAQPSKLTDVRLTLEELHNVKDSEEKPELLDWDEVMEYVSTLYDVLHITDEWCKQDAVVEGSGGAMVATKRCEQCPPSSKREARRPCEHWAFNAAAFTNGDKFTSKKLAGKSGKKCSWYLNDCGCQCGRKCPDIHDEAGVNRQQRCVVCGAKAHASNMCDRPGGAKHDPKKWKPPPRYTVWLEQQEAEKKKKDGGGGGGAKTRAPSPKKQKGKGKDKGGGKGAGGAKEQPTMTRKEKAAAAKEAAKKEEAAKEPTRAEKNIAAQAKQKEEADKRKELEKERNIARHKETQADIQLEKLQRIAAAKASPAAAASGAAAPGALEATITAQRDKARALQASTTAALKKMGFSVARVTARGAAVVQEVVKRILFDTGASSYLRPQYAVDGTRPTSDVDVGAVQGTVHEAVKTSDDSGEVLMEKPPLNADGSEPEEEFLAGGGQTVKHGNGFFWIPEFCGVMVEMTYEERMEFMEWILKRKPRLIEFIVENDLPWVDPKDFERLRKASGLKPLPRPSERVRPARDEQPSASRVEAPRASPESIPSTRACTPEEVPAFCRHGATLTSAFTAGGFCNCDAAAEKRVVMEWVRSASIDEICSSVKDIDKLMEWVNEGIDEGEQGGVRGSPRAGRREAGRT